jgi:hypothetical protein
MDCRRYDAHNRADFSTNEKRVSKSPIHFKLRKLSQSQTLSQIAQVTSGFYDISINAADWIQCDVRSREFSSFGVIPAPLDQHLISLIVGQDNYFLKLTMKKHRIDFIYYDNATEEFHFWGEYQCCVYAMKEFHHRIEKVSAREAQFNEDDIYNPYGYSSTSTSPYASTSQYASSSPYSCASDPEDYILPAEQKVMTLEEQYGKVAKDQMSKMGFVYGTGLGLKNNGRIDPINPVSELGGRTKNLHYGLGYTAQPINAPEVVSSEVVSSEVVLSEVVSPEVVSPEVVAPNDAVAEEEKTVDSNEN